MLFEKKMCRLSVSKLEIIKNKILASTFTVNMFKKITKTQTFVW
jgi:hypothetical protein